MSHIHLEVDEKASKTVNDLMTYFNVHSRAQLFRKALAVLKVAAQINKEHGELIARKGNQETRIIIR